MPGQHPSSSVSTILLEVPSSSGTVEESAAVYTARLAKKGPKTVSSAPWPTNLLTHAVLPPFMGKGDQGKSTTTKASCWMSACRSQTCPLCHFGTNRTVIRRASCYLSSFDVALEPVGT